MFGRYWLLIAALGGCLSGTLALHPRPVFAEPENMEWAEIRSSAIEESATTQAKNQDNNSDQREKDNLIEQRRSADAATRSAASAERQEHLSIWQVAVAGIGTLAFLYSLHLARQANAAALKSVELTELTAKQQLRAYVHVSSTKFDFVGKEYRPNITICLKNYGQTPARNILIRKSSIAKSGQFPEHERAGAESALKDLAPGQEIGITIFPTYGTWQIQSAHVLKCQWTFYVFGEIDYVDVFNKKRHTHFRIQLHIDDTGIENAVLVASPGGNTAT